MKIELCSFGHKYGSPEADMVLDVRCLENPFWVPELKEKNGLEEDVRAYILEHSKEYLEKLTQLLCLHAKLAAGKDCACLRIAVGCTGGRHRSVCVAQLLAEALEHDFEVTLTHRDIARG